VVASVVDRKLHSAAVDAAGLCLLRHTCRRRHCISIRKSLTMLRSVSGVHLYGTKSMYALTVRLLCTRFV
jgi:hypothetical protein